MLLDDELCGFIFIYLYEHICVCVCVWMWFGVCIFVNVDLCSECGAHRGQSTENIPGVGVTDVVTRKLTCVLWNNNICYSPLFSSMISSLREIGFLPLGIVFTRASHSIRYKVSLNNCWLKEWVTMWNNQYFKKGLVLYPLCKASFTSHERLQEKQPNCSTICTLSHCPGLISDYTYCHQLSQLTGKLKLIWFVVHLHKTKKVSNLLCNHTTTHTMTGLYSVPEITNTHSIKSVWLIVASNICNRRL